MILSTVLDLPKVQPDDWDKWWDLWNKNSAVLKRKIDTHNTEGQHIGLDVYRVRGFAPTYEAPYFDLKSFYPSLFEQIMALPVMIYGVRFIHSFGDFPPHMDNLYPNWSIRNMFYCEDPDPQWYYLPKDSKDMEQAKYLTLPPQSNWWAYLDGRIQHATKYSEKYPKILIQYLTNPYLAKKYVETQLNTFPEHNISYD